MAHNRPTLADLARLGIKVSPTDSKPVNKHVLPKVDPLGLRTFLAVLNTCNITYKREYQFAPPRKWRFDIAVPTLMLAIEFEGMVYGGKGGHQTVGGYTANCDKYNAAQLAGWTVLRYTHKNYQNFETDLLTFLKVK